MKKSLCIIILVLLTKAVLAQNKPIYDKVLADSLAAWVKIDQIAANVKSDVYPFKQMNDVQWQHYKDSVFNTHQSILAGIFKQRGYPGYDVVGVTGAHNFWLMVQHCDHHPDFQLLVLQAMEKSVLEKNVDAKDFAYLTDRVALNTGKKQLYGTQVTYDTKICRAYPKPVTDSLQLNDRRKRMGMPPVEVYLNEISQFHFEMNKAFYEAKGITKAQQYPIPSAN